MPSYAMLPIQPLLPTPCNLLFHAVAGGSLVLPRLDLRWVRDHRRRGAEQPLLDLPECSGEIREHSVHVEPDPDH